MLAKLVAAAAGPAIFPRPLINADLALGSAALSSFWNFCASAASPGGCAGGAWGGPAPGGVCGTAGTPAVGAGGLVATAFGGTAGTPAAGAAGLTATAFGGTAGTPAGGAGGLPPGAAAAAAGSAGLIPNPLITRTM